MADKKRKDPPATKEGDEGKAKKKPQPVSKVENWYLKGYHNNLPYEHSTFKVFTEVKKANPSLLSCLYPGSYIHVTPSLVFPEVVYIDNYRGRQDHVVKFFDSENRDDLKGLLKPHQQYEGDPVVRFHLQDLTDLPKLKKVEGKKEFDVLVSLHASGEISRTCCSMIRKGGFLVADDGFGDASLAMSSKEWELVRVFDEKNKLSLEEYFVSKKTKKRLTAGELKMNSGLGFSKRPFPYLHNAMIYLFKKK